MPRVAPSPGISWVSLISITCWVCTSCRARASARGSATRDPPRVPPRIEGMAVATPRRPGVIRVTSSDTRIALPLGSSCALTLTSPHRPLCRSPSSLTTLGWAALLPPVDRDDLDGFRDAPDADLPGLGEGEPRAGGGVSAGDDLGALCQCGDSGGLVDPLAGEVPTDLRRAGGVDPDPDRRTEPLGLPMLREAALDRHRARDGLLRRIEPDEEPISRRRDLLSLVCAEQRAKRLVVPPEDGLPGFVAQGLHQVRGLHDIGEHEGLLHAPRGGPPPKLPGQELLHFIDLDRLGGAGQRRFTKQVLLDAGGVDHVGLGEVSFVPVEGGRRERDAVARPHAPVPIDSGPQHPLSTPPVPGKRRRWPRLATTHRSARTSRPAGGPRSPRSRRAVRRSLGWSGLP